MDVRKKVLLDLFASPSSLIPIVGGLSALILSWALEGGVATTCLGLGMAGVLAGLGIFATRLILGLEDITSRAYEYLHTEKSKKQEEALDQLERKLRKDHDPRTQEGLRELRELYRTFVGDVKAGRITRATHEILEIVEDLFRTSVERLERSYELWESAREMSGPSKEKTLQQREEVVEDVILTIRHLDKTVAQCRNLATEKKRDTLGRLREELDEAIQVARRTEERMASWEREVPTETEFEQE